MIVKTGETREFEFKNRSVGALTFKHYLTHGTSNTALTLDDSVPTNIYVKVELLRGSRAHVLFQDNLRVLSQSTNFTSAVFNLNKVGATTGHIVLLAAASGVYEIGLWGYKIDFHGKAVNLSGDDVLKVTTTANTTSIASDINSNSYVDVDTVEAAGVYEFVTPNIRTWSIAANESRIERNLGDNVTAIYLINTDKSDQLTASQVVTNSTITSKFATINDTYIEILSKNLDMFPTLAEAANRYQSVCLYQGEALDNVSIDLQLSTANVNASKNWLVAISGYTDGRLLGMAEAKRAKHGMQKAISVGAVSPSHASSVLSNVEHTIQSVRPRGRR